MSSVRGKDTAPELTVRRAAHRCGLRFRLHDRSLPGRPDLVFRKWKTVIFVNGCFWHRHPGCKRATVPKSNIDFLQAKFQSNARRDADNYAKLSRMGWTVVVIWQCEAKTIPEAMEIIRARFAKAGQYAGPT